MLGVQGDHADFASYADALFLLCAVATSNNCAVTSTRATERFYSQLDSSTTTPARVGPRRE